MTTASLIMEPLSAKDDIYDRAGFTCGDEALDRYLKIQAGQDLRRGFANIIIAARPGSGVIHGYYTLSTASVDLTQLPDTVRSRLPRYGQVPAVLLGRLAVAEGFQGHGLGALLLTDAVKRADHSELGWAVFLIKAKHGEAASFYRHFGFTSFGHEPLLLWSSRLNLRQLINGLG